MNGETIIMAASLILTIVISAFATVFKLGRKLGKIDVKLSNHCSDIKEVKDDVKTLYSYITDLHKRGNPKVNKH